MQRCTMKAHLFNTSVVHAAPWVWAPFASTSSTGSAFLESMAHPGVSNATQIWIKMALASHATSPWFASMVARGLTVSSAPRPMSQLQGFLLKEDDSTNGDPFLASKFKRRPTRGCCVTKCVREILVMGYDVPHPQFK